MTQGGKTHRLKATPKTVHTGFFDAAIPPVLKIDSGDTVVLSTLMLMDGQLRCGMTLEELIRLRQAYVDRNMGSHTLTGPIFVKRSRTGRRAGGAHSEAGSHRLRGELPLSRRNE